MKVRWKILFASMTMWLVGEIYLNLVGLDEFADYSEFLQDKYQLVLKPTFGSPIDVVFECY